jgi:hypothetical protein
VPVRVDEHDAVDLAGLVVEIRRVQAVLAVARVTRRGLGEGAAFVSNRGCKRQTEHESERGAESSVHRSHDGLLSLAANVSNFGARPELPTRRLPPEASMGESSHYSFFGL